MSNEERIESRETPEEESAQGGAPKTDSPAPEPSRRREEPVRRVGTMTMGFALIVTGIVALAAMFRPSLDLVFVFKLSPLIFVLLGVEILYNYFAHKGQKLKYDLLSGFVCFVLIIAGGCLAAVPAAWNYFGPPAMQVRDDFHIQLRGRISETLVDERDLIGQMYVNAELPYYRQYTPDMSYDELAGDARVYLHLNLNGPYRDKESFAKDCRKILSKLDPLGLDIRNLTIRCDGGEADFGLDLYDRYQLNMDLDELARRVEADWHEEDEEASDRDGLPDEDVFSPLGLSAGEGFTDEWPDRIVYTADGMTAHSYYFDLPVSDPTTAQVDVSTESGTLDMRITGPDGTICFEGYDLSGESGSQTFVLPVSGAYQVRLTADEFRGGFTIQNLG